MTTLTVRDLLPEDGTKGTLVGRVWLPQANGPAVVAVRGDGVFDVTAKFPTVSALCEEDNPAARRSPRSRASASAISKRSWLTRRRMGAIRKSRGCLRPSISRP
ncbi:fumarylacetoacetate (FAA) hydrolase family protein [Bradyrhizobium japonicum]